MTYIIYITAWFMSSSLSYSHNLININVFAHFRLLPVLLAAIMAAIYETLIVKNQGLNSVYQDRLWCING